jgi:hypothetical protein
MPKKEDGSETKEELVESVNELDKAGAPGDEATMLMESGLSLKRSMDSSSELYAEGAEKKVTPGDEHRSLPSKSINDE